MPLNILSNTDLTGNIKVTGKVETDNINSINGKLSIGNSSVNSNIDINNGGTVSSSSNKIRINTFGIPFCTTQSVNIVSTHGFSDLPANRIYNNMPYWYSNKIKECMGTVDSTKVTAGNLTFSNSTTSAVYTVLKSATADTSSGWDKALSFTQTDAETIYSVCNKDIYNSSHTNIDRNTSITIDCSGQSYMWQMRIHGRRDGTWNYWPYIDVSDIYLTLSVYYYNSSTGKYIDVADKVQTFKMSTNYSDTQWYGANASGTSLGTGTTGGADRYLSLKFNLKNFTISNKAKLDEIYAQYARKQCKLYIAIKSAKVRAYNNGGAMANCIKNISFARPRTIARDGSLQTDRFAWTHTSTTTAFGTQPSIKFNYISPNGAAPDYSITAVCCDGIVSANNHHTYGIIYSADDKFPYLLWHDYDNKTKVRKSMRFDKLFALASASAAAIDYGI